MLTRLSHRIAIVGAGPIGSALAGHLILAGNKVTIGTRRPDAFTPPDYQREDIDYPVHTIEAAIAGAEVAILAIPNAAVAPENQVGFSTAAAAPVGSTRRRWQDTTLIGGLGRIDTALKQSRPHHPCRELAYFEASRMSRAMDRL